tara:strand:- start:109 stop:444 length:336 start_codon:yes stop_codon:yes gene_type:complete
MSDKGSKTEERKKIMFYDTAERQAKLRIRCQYDGLSQSQFFRFMLTGYIESDERVLNFLDSCKEKNAIQGKNKRKKIKQMHRLASENKDKFSLKEEEIKTIFDILEVENDL